MTKVNRRSFSLRLQPYQGSLLAEVVDYLNSLDRSTAQRRVEELLVMGLLTQARLDAPGRSPEEQRRTCLEACDALEKHASFLRQLVGVAPPSWQAQTRQPLTVVSGVEKPVRVPKPVAADEPTEKRPSPTALIDGQASAAQMNSLFGD